YPKTNRQKLILVDGWNYHLDKGENGFFSTPPQVSDWEEVTIPHTLKLASLDLDGCEDDHYQLTFHRWIGWYKRELVVNAVKGQKVYLEFEGAHQVTKCWVNGKYVGEHAISGYTPFHFDITAFVKPGGKTNQVVLSVDNRRNPDVPPEGDRYDYIKWSGLYRDVYLVVTDPLHITFPFEDVNHGVFITTPTVSAEDATISIRTHVKNESSVSKTCQVINRVIDQNGVVVLKLKSEKVINPNSSFNFMQTGGIEENVRLWSIEDPYLYRVNTLVLDGGKPVDCIENPMGIRRIEFIDGRGFVLNGKNVELIGANRHQGMLIIGDAVPNSLHWKDAWQMKQAGFNSVRLAHYPHDNSFIEACDQLGILVYEEPPTWIAMGGEKWMENLEEATRRMVRNHRNNPSLLFWAASINHRGPVERLHYAAKEEDPTRPTASNGSPWTGPRGSGVCDIYSPMDYQNRPIQANEFTYLCEHGGSGDASGNQFEASKSRQNANMIGVALWTAHDYQSFKGKGRLSTRRPWTAYRVPNMPFYWYKSELREEPMVFITDKRASTDKEIIVFSNCQKVELYNDGELIEVGYPERSPTLLYIEHPSFKFNYSWVSGELTAKGYINNREVVSHSRKIPGDPYQLKVKIATDNTDFYANGSDIKMVYAYITDQNGTVVPDSKAIVTFLVEGEGAVIGNGELGANPNESFYGVASAYLKSGKKDGTITVTAKAEGLLEGSAEITTIPFESDRILAEAKPIYDLKYERIDLASTSEVIHSGEGGNFEIGQDKVMESSFLQFGWTAWIGEGDVATFKSTVFEGCEMDLSFKDGEPTWFTQWGFVGNLPYLATDGVRVAPGGDIELTIRGLKKGVYTMKSYHNQPESTSGRGGGLPYRFM
ncbi:glycoside hydrolase family 2 TIM barrel-domain containing protein, partial [Bacteroidota bacterium]